MDFASESVRDAFPLPPTRPAQASAAPSDDNGRSFDDHLDAVNDDLRERSAPPLNEAREDRAAPVEARAMQSEDAETSESDVDAALLGGPLPTTPPPIAAPVLIQIAASPEQAPQILNDVAPISPLMASQSAIPETEAKPAEAGAAAQPVARSAPEHGKSGDLDVKDAAPKTAQAEGAPEAQAQRAESEAQQATQQTPAAPVATAELPQALQQAIAATTAPLSQVTAQTSPRASKDAAQAIDAKAAPDTREGKAEAPISNPKTQANAARNAEGGKVTVDAAPIPTTPSDAPDTAQIAENSAISTAASQASTHVQHASAETGAQRAAPAAAQVGREIIRRFNGGTTNFELRLDPADLGRVEVRMEVTRDNRVTAVITADNPQALTELARGARELEQQLESAGLQLTENGLSFDLRQGAQGERDAEEANARLRATSGENTAANEQQPAPVARPIGYERWRGVRVDMMV